MKEIVIGKQIWLNENLNSDTFGNNDKLIEAESSEAWNEAVKNKLPAYCHFNNESENGLTYGKIYNWFAVIDHRNLAPEGFRIPTADDWTELANHIGTNVGTKLKHPDFWNGSAGNNELEFSALPGGSRGMFGNFMDLNKRTGWWSNSEFQPGDTKVWVVNLDSIQENGTANFRSFEILKADIRVAGYYVRCIKK
jgi:uncharacterized protein (TIGR02145 family)